MTSLQALEHNPEEQQYLKVQSCLSSLRVYSVLDEEYYENMEVSWFTSMLE